MAGMKIPSRWKTCPSHGLAMRERVFFQDGTGGFMCEVCQEARMAARWREYEAAWWAEAEKRVTGIAAVIW